MRWFVFFILFSGTVNAITVNQLIDKYGKNKVIKFISKRTDGEVTIYFNGKLKKARMPSPDYVSAMTINRDLASLGLTPNQVDKFFADKESEKEQASIAEMQKKLKRQYRQIVQETKEAKWLEEDKLRKRDRFDLEVERVSRQSQIKKTNNRNINKPNSYKDTQGYKDYLKLPNSYKSPTMEAIFKNGFEAEQRVKNLPSSKGGTISQFLDKKARIPAIEDLGWITAPYKGGFQVERLMLVDSQQLSYRWQVSPDGIVNAENNKAIEITSNEFQKNQGRAIQKIVINPTPPSTTGFRSLELVVNKKHKGNGTIFFGKTNLPDGTKLGVSLKNNGKLGGQDFNIYVKNGRFESSAFTNHGLRIDGSYEMNLFFYSNKLWQKPRILDELKTYKSNNFYSEGSMGSKYEIKKKLRDIKTVQ